MSVTVHIPNGPLRPATPFLPTGAGAVLTFEGVVRPLEDGRRLLSLEYEHYPPMTQREMTDLAHIILREFKLTALDCEHRVGVVAVGEVSFRLRVAAPHRPAAIAAVDAFVARMKQIVPIWKNPVFEDAS